jgi:energy-coupling factor transporter ATP-binding protein EcfA2
LPLIGREAERQRLEENLARGRHTLLVGPIGIGKSHLLRAVAGTLPRAIAVDHIRPIRMSLLAFCQALHVTGELTVAGLDIAALAWPDCARKLARLNVRELTDAVVASLHDRQYVLVLDQLEGATPSMAPTLERFLGEAVVLGATRQLRPGLQKLWWAFESVELAPLSRDEARRLLWSVAEPHEVADPTMFEAKVLAQAAGNPHAIVEMARQAAAAPRGGLQAIRDLWHGAGVRYLDLTPLLLLVGAGLVAARFVALGLDDRDLYILAGSLGALFFVVRYLLMRRGS